MKRLALAVLFVAGTACAHDSSWTQEQFDWVQRRYARNGMHCCGPHDFHMVTGDYLKWRISGAAYEVEINGRWYPVKPGQVMASHAGDPSPFGDGAILFFRVINGEPVIFCFKPESLY